MDTMTSGSFNVSFHCSSLSIGCAAVCHTEVSKAIVLPAASIQQAADISFGKPPMCSFMNDISVHATGSE